MKTYPIWKAGGEGGCNESLNKKKRPRVVYKFPVPPCLKSDNIEVTVHLAGLFFPTPAELIISDHPPFSVGLTKSWVSLYSNLPMSLLGH